VVVTYDMNRLQGLHGERRYLVSLNPPEVLWNPPDAAAGATVLETTRYRHPVYTDRAVATQEPLRRLAGARDTYYCGSYLGHGFHEDAVRAGFEAADRLETDRLDGRVDRESAA